MLSAASPEELEPEIRRCIDGLGQYLGANDLGVMELAGETTRFDCVWSPRGRVASYHLDSENTGRLPEPLPGSSSRAPWRVGTSPSFRRPRRSAAPPLDFLLCDA